MLWGEIKVDSDDLKHMVHRNEGFIGLYNSIMTCLGDLGLLLAVPPLVVKWFGPEVGTNVGTQNTTRNKPASRVLSVEHSLRTSIRSSQGSESRAPAPNNQLVS